MLRNFVWGIVVTTSIITTNVHASSPRLNLFNPYDRLVSTKQTACSDWHIVLALEHAVKAHAYQADEDAFGNSGCFRKRADILQLYQDEQDAIAALKGDTYQTDLSRLAQKFNLNDDNGTHGLFIPTGCLNVDNLMFTGSYYLPYDFALSFYLPFISMSLRNVQWRKSPRNNSQTFDANLVDDLIGDIEKLAHINLHDWDRSGVGDLTAIASWERFFPQARPYLRNVFLNIRGGLVFPTGKKTDEDIFFAPAFGNDAGLGIIGGFNLELHFCKNLNFGADVELMNLWGISRMRRIKTDPAQTDLLFLQKVPVCEDPGFVQHFTLYGEAFQFLSTLSARVAYQFTKQEEVKLYLDTDHFSHTIANNTESLIANNAESLREWTTHSAVFTLSYDFFKQAQDRFKPHVELTYKHGFNGQRAILLDTVTVLFAVDF